MTDNAREREREAKTKAHLARVSAIPKQPSVPGATALRAELSRQRGS